MNFDFEISRVDCKVDLTMSSLYTQTSDGPSYRQQKVWIVAVPTTATFGYSYSVCSVRRKPINRATQ